MNKGELTCSSWQLGLDEQTSCWRDTPSLWPPAARSPSGPSLLGSVEDKNILWFGIIFRAASTDLCGASSVQITVKIKCALRLFCMCTYVSLVADEVAQVAVLHVGQNHEGRALWRQADSQQRENVRVAEVLHDDPFLQELGHLFQICDAFMENKTKQNGNLPQDKRVFFLLPPGEYLAFIVFNVMYVQSLRLFHIHCPERKFA